MEMIIKTKQRTYPIIIEKGCIDSISELLPQGGKRFIITESGIPESLRESLNSRIPDAPVYIFPEGEGSKCLSVYEDILVWLSGNKASRKDIIIALGGGVTGDLAGFAAATYMRGIRYVNIPTTMLSQIDSGIGGKTAVDLNGIKNIVGAFHQPSMVVIDPDTLKTLPQRQLAAGLAEAVKAGLIRDAELFRLFEESDPEACMDEIIFRSLMVKKNIVEEDENETGVRKLLNFGHTFGHAYESFYEGRYLHGECVAMGMMKVLRNEGIKERLGKVLDRLGLDTECSADPVRIQELITNDKKAAGDLIDLVMVDEIGNGHIETYTIEELKGI